MKRSFKIIVIGDSGAGKTCMIRRFTKNQFSPGYLSTIGVEFESKEITVEGKKIQLQIWDTVNFRNLQILFVKRGDLYRICLRAIFGLYSRLLAYRDFVLFERGYSAPFNGICFIF